MAYLVGRHEGDSCPKHKDLIWFTGFSDQLCSDYLFHWLCSPFGQNSLDAIEIGSHLRALTMAGLSSLQIELPPVSIQARIAAILSALDDKITLNRQMNATLDAMAKAIFKE